MEQATADAEIVDIPGVEHDKNMEMTGVHPEPTVEPFEISGVNPANENNNWRPRQSTAGRWKSTRFADEKYDIHTQVFAQILIEHKARLKQVISPHNNTKDIEHIALSQYHMNNGMKLFGKQGNDAIMKEMNVGRAQIWNGFRTPLESG